MQKRPWGEWKRLYINNRVEVRELHIEEDGFCSAHYHKTKADHLSVVKGRLVIQYLEGGKGDLRVTGSVELRPDSPTIWLPAWRIHRFWARTNVLAYEFTVADPRYTLDPDEIHRYTEAGKGNPAP